MIQKPCDSDPFKHASDALRFRAMGGKSVQSCAGQLRRKPESINHSDIGFQDMKVAIESVVR